MEKQEIITRLRAAISEARRPHYGSNDDQIDYLSDGVSMVEDLVKELEKENDMTKKTSARAPWRDEDRALLRTMHQQGGTYKDMAKILNRSVGSIAQQLHQIKIQDKSEGYAHVAAGVTELSTLPIAPKPVSVSVMTSAPEPINVAPRGLTDATLKTFRLFEGGTAEAYNEENPSLWTRIKRWINK